jgi:hypothetical protein
VAGHFSGGRAHLDRAAAIGEPDVHGRLIAARFGFDPGTVFLPLRACAQWLLGFPEAARADAQQALVNGRRSDHVPTLVAVLHLSGSTQLNLGEIEAAKA